MQVYKLQRASERMTDQTSTPGYHQTLLNLSIHFVSHIVRLHTSTPTRRVKHNAHQTSRNDTRRWQCDEPTEVDPRNHAPVDSPPGTVAKTNTDSRTSNALRCRDRQRKLGSHDNRDSSTEFHGETTRRRVQSDLVTERAHNVVSICPETDDDTRTSERENPERDRDLVADLGSRPDEVDGGVGADGVGHVVGAVGERGGGSSQDLEERVGVFGAVVEVLAGGVDLLNVAGEEVAVLLLVDNVLFDTVESSVLGPVEGDGGRVPWAWGRVLLGLGELALGLVDVCRADRWERGDVRVAAVALVVDGSTCTLLDIARGMGSLGFLSTLSLELLGGQVTSVKVANAGNVGGPWGRLRAAEEKRSLDDFPALELPILQDDLAVEKGNEEDSNNSGNTTSDTESDTNGLLVGELDLGRSTLPDNEESKQERGKEDCGLELARVYMSTVNFALTVNWNHDKGHLDWVTTTHNAILGDQENDGTKDT
jgi:hypothetical protein